MYTDVDGAGERYSWTAAVARPACGERERERERERESKNRINE